VGRDGSEPSADTVLKASVLPLRNRDGKAANQLCRLAEISIVLVFNESGELLNTFVVSVQKRSVID
jgi:hypothetical protein